MNFLQIPEDNRFSFNKTKDIFMKTTEPRQRRGWVAQNNLVDRARAMDSEAVSAYERYVMAPVKFADKG